MNKAVDIEEALTGMANQRQALQMKRFFKTSPGDYGEGDRFIGLRNPQVRMVVKEVWKQTPLSEAGKLVSSPLHEARLCGLLILVEQYLKVLKKRDNEAMSTIFDFYTLLHPHINNWDLVDLSATKIVGNHEVVNPGVTLMDEWINPDGHTLWQQRIAMVSCWQLVRSGRADVCFRRAGTLLSSEHDLLHKAAGWMLREAWNQGYKDELRMFIEQNAAEIPSITLSYACEKMHDDERRKWQLVRKSSILESGM